MRGDLVMLGYYKNEARPARPRLRLASYRRCRVIDPDGFLYIVDRKKDMIISGGFNIFPSEVEQAIWCHPAVQDCAVIGVPDDKWGEAVKAVIELKPGLTVTEDEIIHLCKDKLGSPKAPKSVEFCGLAPQPGRQSAEEGLARALLGGPRAQDLRDRRQVRRQLHDWLRRLPTNVQGACCGWSPADLSSPPPAR